MNSSQPFRHAVRTGLKAAKANRIPAILLWFFGLTLIVAYSQVPSVHHLLEQLREVKEQWGLIFSAISTALVAGLIPPVISKLAGQEQADLSGPYLVSNLIFWAYKGIEVDLLYRLQAIMFGDSPHAGTVAAKVAVDQLVYAPAIGLTNVVLFYLWRESGYSATRFRNLLGPAWFQRKVLPVLVSNWFVWIPACILVYLLPLGLQLPIQNLILCFWVLILTFFTSSISDQSDHGLSSESSAKS